VGLTYRYINPGCPPDEFFKTAPVAFPRLRRTPRRFPAVCSTNGGTLTTEPGSRKKRFVKCDVWMVHNQLRKEECNGASSI
jgi:hypothetical protein